MFWEVYALDRQEYLKSLTEQIRTKRARTMVAEEVEAHIEDQKQDFMAHGLGEEEAESMAVVEMGDPVEAGVKLDRVHRPKMEWTVLMAILIISIMGLILQAVVTSSFPTMNMSTLEAFKDNFLYGGIWSAMLIGIAVMLGICYLDYSILVKWSFPIWAVMQIPAVFSIVSKLFFDETMWIGPMVNGRSIVQMLLSYLVIPFYAGTIYHFRRKGTKGLIISTVCLGISVLTDLMIPFMSSAVVTGITGLVLLHVAVCKGWFGENKKKFLTRMWGVIGICLLLMSGITFWCNGRFVTDYQVHRLEALITGEHWDYTRGAVADVANAAKDPNSSKWHAVLSGDQLYAVGNNDQIEIKAWLDDLVPNYGCCRMNMNTDFVKKNPTTVKLLLKSLIRAEQWYLANKEECVKILAKEIGAEEDYVAAYLLNDNYVSSVDPCKNSVVKTWEAMIKM